MSQKNAKGELIPKSNDINLRDLIDERLKNVQYFNQLARGKKAAMLKFNEDMESIMKNENLYIE